MDIVSLFDAKNRLSALVDQVEAGAEVTITRRGKAVARLVPTGPRNEHARDAAKEILTLRQGIAARGKIFTRDELTAYRDEGRR